MLIQILGKKHVINNILKFEVKTTEVVINIVTHLNSVPIKEYFYCFYCCYFMLKEAFYCSLSRQCHVNCDVFHGCISNRAVTVYKLKYMYLLLSKNLFCVNLHRA